MENYKFTKDKYVLTQTPVGFVEREDSPTAVCIRQRQMQGKVSCKVECDSGEAGIALYMDETHHYDLCMYKTDDGYRAVKRSCIGGVECEQNIVRLDNCENLTLQIRLEPKDYFFSIAQNGKVYDLGKLETRYLSSEVACGFTGVMFALYAWGDRGERAVFTDFCVDYHAQ